MQTQLPLETKSAKKAIKLFPYQEEALNEFIAWYRDPYARESLIALATGLGKTITASACVKNIIDQGGRVLWITHRDEMIQQSSNALYNLTGENVGIEKASQRAEYNDKIVVASVQSLKGRRLENFSQYFTPALIVFDEAHHSLAKTWIAIKLKWPEVKVLNLTATPYRQDIGNRLNLGKVLIEKNTTDGINMKRLVPPKPVGTLGVSLDGCKISMGDYDVTTLSSLLMEPAVIEESVALIQKHIPNRRGIIFAASVEHGKILSEALDAVGISNVQIYAETTREERAYAFNQIREGQIQVLINNLVLTEGFDLPELDLVAIFRPTKNAALYLQMLGRGLRVAPNKTDCLVIDAIDSKKRSTGHSKLIVPTEVERAKVSALLNKQISLLEVFLSWFYRQEEIAEHLLYPSKNITYTKIITGVDLFKALCPTADINNLREAQLKMITDTTNLIVEGTYKSKTLFNDFASILHCNHVEGLIGVLNTNGWVYYPHGLIPNTEEDDERISQEVDEAVKSKEKAYTMECLANVEPTLQNFILNVMQTSNLRAQAKKYFIRHNTFGIEASWTIPLSHQGEYTMIRLDNPDRSIKHYFVRDEITGQIYEVHVKGGMIFKWTEVTSADYLLQRIPAYSRSYAWTQNPITPKQLPHVMQILKMTEEAVRNLGLSSMAAACLMENQFSKAAHTAIAKKLPKHRRV